MDVFAKRMSTGVVTRVATTATGANLPPTGDDGRYLTPVTAAKVGTTTPTASWTAGAAYRVDTFTRTVVPLGSGQHTLWEHQAELDPPGQFGFFATATAELPADRNGHYRRDVVGVTPLVLVTWDAGGAATAGPTGVGRLDRVRPADRRPVRGGR